MEKLTLFFGVGTKVLPKVLKMSTKNVDLQRHSPSHFPVALHTIPHQLYKVFSFVVSQRAKTFKAIPRFLFLAEPLWKFLTLQHLLNPWPHENTDFHLHLEHFWEKSWRNLLAADSCARATTNCFIRLRIIWGGGNIIFLGFTSLPSWILCLPTRTHSDGASVSFGARSIIC